MKPNLSLPAAGGGLILGLVIVAGCTQEPMAPQRAVALSVTMNPKDNVQAALLGSAQNEVLYRVDGTGEPALHQVYGPFSMPVSSGSVSFTVNVPQGNGPQVLSLQLNNAANHQPLAVGAAGFDFGTGLEGGLVVEMGSVTRTCYYVNTDNTAVGAGNYSTGYIFDLETDAMTGIEDLAVTTCATCPIANSYYFLGAPPSTPGPGPVTLSNIAYLGKGDLVDFDYVPPSSAFYTTSLAAKGGAATLEAGDVYCIQLQSAPGAHAWVQVTDPGLSVGALTYGPAFRYRLNSTFPFFAYEQSVADQKGSCSSY